MSAQSDIAVPRPVNLIERLSNAAVLIAFAGLVVFFSLVTDKFLTAENLFNLISNKVVLLAIVALGMTIVIGAGGSTCRSVSRSTSVRWSSSC